MIIPVLPDTESQFPLTNEDVIQIREIEILYKNGQTQVTNEVSPDSAGGSQFFTDITLYELTDDVSVTYPKISKDSPHPVHQPFATVTQKKQPTHLFMSNGAHIFGRGLSSFSGARMMMSKNAKSNSDTVYQVSVEGEVNLPNFSIEIYVDKTKGFCWSEAYFYNQDGLYLECHASDFREVNGQWFPFTTEMIYYLPENKWTEENKIRKRNIYEITSIETQQPYTLNADDLMHPGMAVYH